MRFYLSIFPVEEDFKSKRPLESIQQSFLRDISASGHDYHDGSIFIEYPTIYEEIEKSDILVAFIDKYWMSSTWKAIELWYAVGASPENDGKFIHSPLPCYIYCIDKKNKNIQNVISKHNVELFDGSFEQLMNCPGFVGGSIS